MASDHSSDLNRATIGVGQFLMGFTMACVGGYLVSNQVIVAGSYWSFYGTNTFGVTLVPMLIGIAMLCWSGRSTLGWLLTAGGALFILAGVIVNMHIYFQPSCSSVASGCLRAWRGPLSDGPASKAARLSRHTP